MAKAFLRWAGSKKKLIPHLVNHIDWRFKRYIEPFVGSAQLFFSLNPASAVLSDINKDLINTYKIVRSNYKEVHKALLEFSISQEEYYNVRSWDVNQLSNIMKAARFIYLNRFCFNGLYRTNLNGEFNVPYGGYKTGNLPELQTLKEISRSLKKAKLIAGDFEDVIIANVLPGDFIYFDPPYAVQNARVFNQYNPQTFGLSDLERLSILLLNLHENGNRFLVSYAYCEEALYLLNRWKPKKVRIQRSISGFGKSRNASFELIAHN
jgi:DNA adenine methylase (dam)